MVYSRLVLDKSRLKLTHGCLEIVWPKRVSAYPIKGAVFRQLFIPRIWRLEMSDGRSKLLFVPPLGRMLTQSWTEFFVAFEKCGGTPICKAWRGTGDAPPSHEVVRSTKLDAFLRSKPDWLVMALILGLLAAVASALRVPWWISSLLAFLIFVLAADQGLMENPFAHWRRVGAALSSSLEELRFDEGMVIGIGPDGKEAWRLDLSGSRLIQETRKVKTFTVDKQYRLLLATQDGGEREVSPSRAGIDQEVRRACLSRGIPLELRVEG